MLIHGNPFYMSLFSSSERLGKVIIGYASPFLLKLTGAQLTIDCLEDTS